MYIYQFSASKRVASQAYLLKWKRKRRRKKRDLCAILLVTRKPRRS